MSFNQVFTKIVKDKRPIMTIIGGHDQGKTNFALYLFEKAYKLGLVKELGTNIRTVDDERVVEVTSYPFLKRWLRSSNAMKWFTLDEAGLHVYRRNPLSKKTKSIVGISFLIRKFHAKMIFIAQRSRDIEGTFLDPAFNVCKFKKITREYAEFLSPHVEGVGEIYPIPSCTIKFDTWDSAPFTMDARADEVIKGRALCCQVARLFLEHGTYSGVAHELGDKTLINHPMKVKRLLIEHLKHG